MLRSIRTAFKNAVAGVLASAFSGVVTFLVPMPAHADKIVRPAAAPVGGWVVIGQTHARHTADHDTIAVQGPADNFRRLKIKVTDAPLHMEHMIVTYDNGQPDRIEVRQNIARGGESRVIDLRGVGKRSIRRIDFWYDSQGMMNGRADVTVFGQH